MDKNTSTGWTANELRKHATELFMNSRFATKEEVLAEVARMNRQAAAIDKRNGVIDECPF